MDRLRLIITKDCNRSCAGCCNKDWDIENLPVFNPKIQYEEIYITGGEPLLYLQKVRDIVKLLRKRYPKARLIIYTAYTGNFLYYAMKIVDGITLTLHEQEDVNNFNIFEQFMNTPYNRKLAEKKSLRLNVFKGIQFKAPLLNWKIKDGIEWLKNCPLPEGEELRRWEDI